ncbi:MAG TPA: TolC family protein, partial [Gemmatimonadales bacterium]
ARISGLRADASAAQANVAAAVMGLTARVTRAYLDVLSAQGRLEAQDQSLAALGAERSRVSQALEVGRAAQVDVLRVDAALAQAETERVTTAADRDVAVAVLARLLGIPPDGVGPARLAEVALQDTSGAASRDALLHRATAANPDLAAARQRRDAADQARRVARAAWFPRLELGGGYLVYGSGAGDFTSEWQGALRVAYPLFQGGARQSAVAAATARADGAAEQYRLAELELLDALDGAVAGARAMRAGVAAVSRAVAHLAEVRRIEGLALEAGAGTQADFLRADADLRRSRATLIEARHGEILARVELLRLTGELTPERLDQLVESLP